MSQDPNNIATEELKLIHALSARLGIVPTQLVSAIARALPEQSNKHLNSTCPKCSNRYRVYDHGNYPEDQSVCPSCRDEAMAADRAKMQRPEREAAERQMAEMKAQEQAVKNQDKAETAGIVAAAVAEALKNIIPQTKKAA
jgi:hypothetical protein